MYHHSILTCSTQSHERSKSLCSTDHAFIQGQTVHTSTLISYIQSYTEIKEKKYYKQLMLCVMWLWDTFFFLFFFLPIPRRRSLTNNNNNLTGWEQQVLFLFGLLLLLQYFLWTFMPVTIPSLSKSMSVIFSLKKEFLLQTCHINWTISCRVI